MSSFNAAQMAARKIKTPKSNKPKAAREVGPITIYSNTGKVSTILPVTAESLALSMGGPDLPGLFKGGLSAPGSFNFTPPTAGPYSSDTTNTPKPLVFGGGQGANVDTTMPVGGFSFGVATNTPTPPVFGGDHVAEEDLRADTTGEEAARRKKRPRDRYAAKEVERQNTTSQITPPIATATLNPIAQEAERRNSPFTITPPIATANPIAQEAERRNSPSQITPPIATAKANPTAQEAERRNSPFQITPPIATANPTAQEAELQNSPSKPTPPIATANPTAQAAQRRHRPFEITPPIATANATAQAAQLRNSQFQMTPLATANPVAQEVERRNSPLQVVGTMSPSPATSSQASQLPTSLSQRPLPSFQGVGTMSPSPATSSQVSQLPTSLSQRPLPSGLALPTETKPLTEIQKVRKFLKQHAQAAAATSSLNAGGNMLENPSNCFNNPLYSQSSSFSPQQNAHRFDGREQAQAGFGRSAPSTSESKPLGSMFSYPTQSESTSVDDTEMMEQPSLAATSSGFGSQVQIVRDDEMEIDSVPELTSFLQPRSRFLSPPQSAAFGVMLGQNQTFMSEFGNQSQTASDEMNLDSVPELAELTDLSQPRSRSFPPPSAAFGSGNVMLGQNQTFMSGFGNQSQTVSPEMNLHLSFQDAELTYPSQSESRSPRFPPPSAFGENCAMVDEDQAPVGPEFWSQDTDMADDDQALQVPGSGALSQPQSSGTYQDCGMVDHDPVPTASGFGSHSRIVSSDMKVDVVQPRIPSTCPQASVGSVVLSNGAASNRNDQSSANYATFRSQPTGASIFEPLIQAGQPLLKARQPLIQANPLPAQVQPQVQVTTSRSQNSADATDSRSHSPPPPFPSLSLPLFLPAPVSTKFSPTKPDFAEMGEVEDSLVAAKCPPNFTAEQRLQFFAAYRVRALNKGMKAYMGNFPLGGHLEPAMVYYLARRNGIAEALESGLANLRRKQGEDSSPSKKARALSPGKRKAEVQITKEGLASIAGKRLALGDDKTQPAPKPSLVQRSESAPLTGSLFAPDNRSGTSSAGAGSSRGSSIFDAVATPKPTSFGSNNIFGHLSDVESGADSGKGNDDDDTDEDAGASCEQLDDEKMDAADKPQTYGNISTHVEESGPSTASTTQPTSIFNRGTSNSTSGTSSPGGSLFDRISRESNGNPIRQLPPDEEAGTLNKPQTYDNPSTHIEESGPSPQPTSIFNRGTSNSTSGTSSLGGSLFDRISRDSNGNPVRQLPPENQENAIPTTPAQILGADSGNLFARFGTTSTTDTAKMAQDNTWKQDSPIKFGSSTASLPSVEITAPTPNKLPPHTGLFGSTPPKSSSPTLAGTVTPFTGFGVVGIDKPSFTSPISNPPPIIFGNTSTVSFTAPTSNPPLRTFGNTSTPNSIPSLFANPDSENKPPTMGFGFGGVASTTASSLFPSPFGSTTTSRATTPGGTTDGDTNDENAEPEPENETPINLTGSGPGEENEIVIYEVRAKALKFETKENGSTSWVVKGLGPLRVLKNKETGSSRILIRSDPSGAIVLNKGIIGNLTYEATGKTLKLPTAGEGGHGLETWLIQVKVPEAAQELARHLEENKRKY